jgi:hypothetical protein
MSRKREINNRARLIWRLIKRELPVEVLGAIKIAGLVYDV